MSMKRCMLLGGFIGQIVSHSLGYPVERGIVWMLFWIGLSILLLSEGKS